MSEPIDIEKMFQAFTRANPKYDDALPAAQAVWRTFFEQLPRVLGSELTGSPLTATTFLTAKVTTCRHLVNSGLYAELLRADPHHYAGCELDHVETVIRHNTQIIIDAIEEHERTLGHVSVVPTHLAEKFERTFFKTISGFAHNTLAKWYQGGMTVADLLTTEPARLFVFR